MYKRRLHHFWTIVRAVKVRYLFVLLLASTAVTIIALRANNVRMIQLRNNVYAADERAGNVEIALQDLRKHVHSHMNTSLSVGNNIYPPIQLKHTYQRLQQAEKGRVQRDNAKVYTEAQNYCEQQNPTGFSGRGRVPCIEEYVTARKVTEHPIPDAMYKFDFVSPAWSPDLAGYGFVTSILLFVLLALRIAARPLLKYFGV
ncbi:MAG TPA: hypothetical protein VFM05_00345 [Candidatus Saccharimonadales bacterium]|nr:hypothetical protein [Candidatus Saccharimonadales bacterium]